MSKYLDKHEASRLMQSLTLFADQGSQSSRAKALMIWALLETGMRLDELCKVQLRHINFKTGGIQVNASKGSLNRSLTLSKALLNALQSHPRFAALQSSDRLLGLIALQYCKDPPISSAKEIIRRFFRQLKVKVFGPGPSISLHGLRHTAAVQLLKATNDLLAVKSVLGHKSLNSTHHYIDVLKQEEAASMLAAVTHNFGGSNDSSAA